VASAGVFYKKFTFLISLSQTASQHFVERLVRTKQQILK